MVSLAFFPLDLLMDFAMLLVVQLSFGSLRPRRLLAAAAVLAACTAAFLLLNLPPAHASLLHLPVFILSAQIATDERRPGRILEAAACMLCTGAAAAGFVSLGGGMAFPFAAAGAGLLLFLLRRRRHENYRWNIEVYVEKDGLGASFPALVDTGNRLREHESCLPVLIAEAGAMPRIAEHIRNLSPEQTQTLPFGVLGSTGEICCFQPDRVEIILPGRGRCCAPPCWVAVYPGRIPGSIRALAPPAFATVPETRRPILKKHFEFE